MTNASAPAEDPATDPTLVEQRVAALLAQMTLEEKIGQMDQVDASDPGSVEQLQAAVRGGRVGAVIHLVDVDSVNELQRIATQESRLGIPLLVGRDVVHGFKTVMPIPLGQAASWNPDAVRRAARIAAVEAASAGVNWTFAPMIDISRDPRWGRIAESLGEDPYLTGTLGAAMIEGFQGEDLAAIGSIAACAKHFAGYGAAESGRDYAATNIPENELRNVYLRPFRTAADAGVATFMASFSDIDGVPASGNEFLMRQILRDEWGFRGFVVSDWDSVAQLAVHGLTAGDRESALEAVIAGVDMEMAGRAYSGHLAELVREGLIPTAVIDTAVANILRVKFALGLFDNPYTTPAEFPPIGAPQALAVAREAALQSVVLLKNDDRLLPLSAARLTSLAVIGPLADAPYEQLGTWIFDGDPGMSVTGLQGIRDLVGDGVTVNYVQAMATSRSRETEPFDAAVTAAAAADAAVLFLGEESILSGEAHSRADIGLPGAQAELVRRVRQTGKPVIAVILAGRPLTLSDIIDQVDAVLFAWHPGTMGGAAIADLLFGIESPSGKLPATFPKMVGQIPIYYNHKNTGKPPTADGFVHIDAIDANAPQTSLGMQAFHLDAGYTPLYPFGYGLSYAEFAYEKLRLDAPQVAVGEALAISVEVRNTGAMAADEIVQLYIRDLVGNVTRPVKELKGFRRIRLEPGQTVTVSFSLHTDDLAFFGRNNRLMIEPGRFHLWVGGSSDSGLRSEFALVPRE
ncbi:MAG: glycoside hydrolase family 3 N-terminal domain-containing protein [Pseudomonadales bacterium]